MTRLFEILLGLEKGFLSHEGNLSIQFNPHWPLQQYVGGAAVWNLLLILGILALVVHVYRRDGRNRSVRIWLGVIRTALLALVLFLLNDPVLTLGQVRREPSVLAILVDDSLSMKVNDVKNAEGKPLTRLGGVDDLLTGNDSELLRQLCAVHDIRLYSFDRGVRQIASINGPGNSTKSPRKRMTRSTALSPRFMI